MVKKKRICITCKKEFPATTEYFYQQSGGRPGLRSYCKKCNSLVGTKSSKKSNARRVLQGFREVIKQYKTDRCMLCNTKLKNKGWIQHHISYTHDATVLICRACHYWLHGGGIHHHAFKRNNTPDKSAYLFADAVTRLYLKYDPEMQETIRINPVSLEEESNESTP